MNGILNVLKPPGMTSFDIVGFLRGVLKIKKIGHTGTLDPGAAGVLPVCIGSATGAVEYLTEKDKVYRAELTLGVETDTQDSFGNILCEKKVNLTQDEVEEAIYSFKGEYSQLPPMFSAIKIGGEKLCDLARKGISVEREHRNVKIHSINIISIDMPRIIFDVSCSKGTYIRTLCHDIGQKLNVGGHMSFLLRLKAGAFDIGDALTVEEITTLYKNNKLAEKIRSVDMAFMQYESVMPDDNMIKKLFCGQFVSPDRSNIKNGFVRVYNLKEDFIALGEIFEKEGKVLLKIKKRF